MKNTFYTLFTLFISLASYAGDDNPKNPGENLDLTAVLNLFEKSESVEDFENKLNSEKNDVNNLDLNEDGFVDYIRVIDHAEGSTHSLTLQVPYSDSESQDVAVIHLDEEGESTSIQIVGDESVYGEETIIEPGDDSSDKVVNVYHWKPVRHIYGPKYVVWVSPFRFGVYPKWYRPWKPVKWTVYRAHVRRHRVPCRRVHIYRSHRAHNHYHKHRKHSHTFHKKHVVVKSNTHKAVHKNNHKKNHAVKSTNHTKQTHKTNRTSPKRRTGGKH